jgi:glucose-1-phosphate adenylyltransferase
VEVTRSADSDVLVVILAGGRGLRLGGLTARVAKPAVPFGGQYRIIDFALSNCVNSGLRRIAVLTQYQAHALIVHLQSAWGFLHRNLDEFLEIWPAQQDRDDRWYGGTADAVYQNLASIRRHGASRVLVLPGDHVSQIDYRPLLASHATKGAGVTVACAPVPVADAFRYGILETDGDGRIESFVEKPLRVSSPNGAGGTVLASLGAYVFDRACLEAALDRAAPLPEHDFGRHLIPDLVRRGQARAHVVANGDGTPCYWRDVGTLDAYYDASMALLDPGPRLDLGRADWPLRAHIAAGVPARFRGDGRELGIAVDSLVAAGCVVSGALVRRSLLSRDVRVEPFARVEESVVLPGAVIGSGARIHRAIVDSGCEVPAGARIDGRGRESAGPTFVCRESFTRRDPAAAGRATPSREREGSDIRRAGAS